MGQTARGTPDNFFRPQDPITRAQIITILSRILYGNRGNWSSINQSGWRYDGHKDLLTRAGIITNINPGLLEKNEPLGRFLLMIIRATMYNNQLK
ncbi:MAG: S-layer homology domain-containing protein [Candidatus Absconditabacterales bacterium]|nr:S-layer homology domain-containing protein [Candidatus Absconditabacterales bacterium]